MTILIFIFILIIIVNVIYFSYRLCDDLNKPLPDDARCRNCRTTLRDGWQEIYCNNKKSNVYSCMVDDYSRCRFWKHRKPKRTAKTVEPSIITKSE